MGSCKYCGKPAGLFRNKHAACEEANKKRELAIQNAKAEIFSEALSAIKGIDEFSIVDAKISEITLSNNLQPQQNKYLFIRAWETAVDNFLEDGVLDTLEEKRLVEFSKHFSLSQTDLDGNGALTKTAKAGILREVLEGNIPKRLSFDGTLPINFQKGETVVWVFKDARYLEDKTRRQYVGKSHGVSIRIMKGVYYRVGAFKGQPVENTERIHVDTGLVVVTDKNIYFAGPQKSLRIPYKKIVSFEPFSDGLGIMRDAATAKPQIFATGDGWFTYNLVTNLCQL